MKEAFNRLFYVAIPVAIVGFFALQALFTKTTGPEQPPSPTACGTIDAWTPDASAQPEIDCDAPDPEPESEEAPTLSWVTWLAVGAAVSKGLSKLWSRIGRTEFEDSWMAVYRDRADWLAVDLAERWRNQPESKQPRQEGPQ